MTLDLQALKAVAHRRQASVQLSSKFRWLRAVGDKQSLNRQGPQAGVCDTVWFVFDDRDYGVACVDTSTESAAGTGCSSPHAGFISKCHFQIS